MRKSYDFSHARANPYVGRLKKGISTCIRISAEEREYVRTRLAAIKAGHSKTFTWAEVKRRLTKPW